MGAYCVCQHYPIKHDILRSELQTLFSFVDFSNSPSVLDICGGQRVLSGVLRELQFSVVTNSVHHQDLTDYHYDAMQPESYRKLRLAHGCHVIVATPAYDIIDVVLPLAAMYAQHFACCRVPCRYINDRPLYPARNAWLELMRDQGRLLIVHPTVSEDAFASASGFVWLVVFATEELRQLLVSLH